MEAAVSTAVDIPEQQVMNGISINADLTQGPFYIDGHDTLPKLFAERCGELGERTAHREKEYGIWLSYTWSEFYTHAKLIGLGLVSLGLKRGEVVSILSEDNKEWIYTDLGVQCAGGIASGIYTTDSATQLEYLVNDFEQPVPVHRKRRTARQVPRGQGSHAGPRQGHHFTTGTGCTTFPTRA